MSANNPAQASIAYTIELTADEYRSACYMCDRGYLAGITEHATETETAEDETTVTLRFRESDAWLCMEQANDDWPAVWALTTTRTSLGEKLLNFLEGIV